MLWLSAVETDTGRVVVEGLTVYKDLARGLRAEIYIIFDLVHISYHCKLLHVMPVSIYLKH